MQNLLPQDVLDHILLETGALTNGKVSRVIRGDFKRFDFQSSKKKMIDLSVFEAGINKITTMIEKDWRLNYVEGCVLMREKEQLTDLYHYTFREGSLCTQINTRLFKDSFLVYLGRDTFFCMLNEYLGGEDTTPHKDGDDLTEIEEFVLRRIMDRISDIITMAFAYLDRLDLKVTALEMEVDAQEDEFAEKHLLTDFSFEKNGATYRFALAIPHGLINHIQEKQAQKSRSGGSRKDPLWEEAITNAFFVPPLDLQISLGQLDVPFGKIAGLKVGEVISWDKSAPTVKVCLDDKPLIKGTMGVVDDNFAVKVEERLY